MKDWFMMYYTYDDAEDFVGMDMCRKFLEMIMENSCRYANHKDGKSMMHRG